jgi:hypothetical protein
VSALLPFRAYPSLVPSVAPGHHADQGEGVVTTSLLLGTLVVIAAIALAVILVWLLVKDWR